jgi:hypothetical protein
VGQSPGWRAERGDAGKSSNAQDDVRLANREAGSVVPPKSHFGKFPLGGSGGRNLPKTPFSGKFLRSYFLQGGWKARFSKLIR